MARELIELLAEIGDKSLSAEHGVKRASILFRLRSIHFTRSFPLDVMHCVLINVHMDEANKIS